MHKILIIEDRSSRKDTFLDESIKTELLKFEDILVFVEAEKYSKLKNELNSNHVEYLNQYSVIILHRSAFEHSILDIIKSHCREKHKPLVFFSGGISASYFDETSYPFLTINSKEFYSKNLIFFLEKIQKVEIIELPILQYGVNWELNFLMEARNSLSNYLIKNPNANQVTRNALENEIRLRGSFLNVLSDSTKDNSWIQNGIKEDAFEILNDLLQEIKIKIDEYIKRL